LDFVGQNPMLVTTVDKKPICLHHSVSKRSRQRHKPQPQTII